MKAKKTVYGSMKNGGKMYKNGGKTEELPEGKMDPKEKANYGARKARRQAINEARKEGRATAAKPGKKRLQKTLAQRGVEKKGDTSLFGPESLRRGKRRRVSRRLERSAEKAGISKDKAYSSEAALRTAAKADDAGDTKKRDAALKTEKLQRKYQGEKVVTTIGKKKNKRVDPIREPKKPRGGRSAALFPTFTKRSGKGRVAAGRRRAINEALNRRGMNRTRRQMMKKR